MARNGSLQHLGYTAPELHTGAIWYIDYYTWSEEAGTRRHRIKVNKPKDLVARRAHARALIAELTARLRRGWRPHHVVASPKAHYTLQQAMDAYLRHKTMELRLSSPAHYDSWCRLFAAWAREQNMLGKEAHLFSKGDAVAYMDHLTVERGYKTATWHTHRVAMAMMFGWMVERQYRPDNPFAGIKGRKKEQKLRTFLTQQEREQMHAWLVEHHRAFLLPCMFVFHTLVRPRELTRLRVSHLDLERQVITLPGAITKNGRNAQVAIADAMMPELLAAGLERAPRDWFVMGAGWRPGPKPAHRNAYQRMWAAMRKDLGWPASKQFYSLRDTGIIQLLHDGCELLHVMQQARHANVETTNQYLKHAFPAGVREVRSKASPMRGTTAPPAPPPAQ